MSPASFLGLTYTLIGFAMLLMENEEAAAAFLTYGCAMAAIALAVDGHRGEER